MTLSSGRSVPGEGQPTIDHRAVAKLLDMMPTFGVDPRRICRSVGMDAGAASDGATRTPISTLHAVWEEIMAVTGRHDLSLAVAQRYTPGDYALLGFAAMTSPTIADALRQIERYMGLWTDDPSAQFAASGRLRFCHRKLLQDRPGRHRADEAGLAEVIHGMRHLTQRRIVPKEVRFQHAAPAATSALAAFHEFFGAPVFFAQPATELTFTSEDLAIQLPDIDEHLRAFLQRAASTALQTHAERETLLGRLRSILAAELRRGVPGMDETARQLAMSTRTLRRRLDREGTSFREVIDRTRAELAQGYVRDRRLGFSEVAFLLGFTEPSAFHRAFKRWTGATPGAWRKGQP